MESGSSVEASPFILCYDGSENASNAIRQAGAITGGGAALLAHVWVRPSALLFQGRAIDEDHPLAPAAAEFDAVAHETAERITAEGVKLAEVARFVARPVTIASARRVWRPLVELADEHEARALIVGSHGVSGVTSVLLGSVSHSVVVHSRRPVIVVPSAGLSSQVTTAATTAK